jgi:hypothetical protein
MNEWKQDWTEERKWNFKSRSNDDHVMRAYFCVSFDSFLVPRSAVSNVGSFLLPSIHCSKKNLTTGGAVACDAP